jgi:hypothetical protein
MAFHMDLPGDNCVESHRNPTSPPGLRLAADRVLRLKSRSP